MVQRLNGILKIRHGANNPFVHFFSSFGKESTRHTTLVNTAFHFRFPTEIYILTMMISSRCTIILTLFCVLLKVYDANAFSIHRSNVHKKVQASNAHRWVQAGTTLTARRRSLDDYDDELDDVDEINGSGVLPLLPPTGFSSFDELSNKINLSSSASEEKSSSSSPKSAVVSPKFELQYTCNICETRNTINVSRVGTFHFFIMQYILSFFCSVCFFSSKVTLTSH